MDSVGILVSKDELRIAHEELVSALYERFPTQKIIVTENIALLSLIGEGLADESAGEILKAMKEIGARPILLDGGADSLGMTVGFHEKYLETLVKRISHDILRGDG